MRAFNSTQTLQDQFTNTATADVKDRNGAADLGNSGHAPYSTSSKGDRDTALRTVVMCHQVLISLIQTPVNPRGRPQRPSAPLHCAMHKPAPNTPQLLAGEQPEP